MSATEVQAAINDSIHEFQQLLEVKALDEVKAGFPELHGHLPRVWTVGIADRQITAEPLPLSPYHAKYDGKWILIVSHPGCWESAENPHAREAVTAVFRSAQNFASENCHVFLLSTDGFWKQRSLMDSIGDPEGFLTLMTDPELVFSKKLGILCGAELVKGGHGPICYPAFFLLTPDKELVQFAVLRDPEHLVFKSRLTVFGYPYNDRVMDEILGVLVMMKPLYSYYSELKGKAFF